MDFSASLTISDLWIERSDRALCRALSYTVRAGEAVRILGENGAGKSSLLKVMSGAMAPLEGHLYFADQDITADRTLLQQSMIYIGHSSGLKSMLTVEENLRCYCPNVSAKTLYSALVTLGLIDYQDSYIKALSAGQARRVALARLWLSHKAVWLLDEPFAALDVSGAQILEAHIQDHLRSGGMVVFTTHQALSSLAHRELVLTP